ncbi:MAG: hypothetical protein QW751_00040 [Candidatus Aenigmatarchaeota archaeon]|nr:hypothetical protein [Candidatus Aenigmarchaeota archaeon]
MDKHSPHYLRSNFSYAFHGNDKSTTYVRELKVDGNDPTDVRVAAEWIRGKVMP